MTLNLKTEIEKINQGCGERIFPKENPDNIKCGTIWNKRIHLCPSCQKYKQGLIQGAKMMIENELKLLNKTQPNMKICGRCYLENKDIEARIIKEISELKQLNNWLEKE